MSASLEAKEMAQLLALPAFRRFLWRAVRAAGLLHPAYGTDGRDLAYREGRRSLALDLLRMAEAGQPFPHPEALSTWASLLGEELQFTTEKTTDDRRDEWDGGAGRSRRRDPAGDDGERFAG
ncbi:Bbp19 family protein [Flavisphingomonas formosensis]|uniref:Bbp19 family protein n=1 Tax=Flavisphingomonas formosensis TaxID=861534 RepID=UPI0018E028E1|nr:hypothetical protein [Sphingomonas formosensis]